MAISNHRITAFDGERVSFLWRDYAHGGKQKVMTLDAVNFLCRFFLHVLPKGFVRIRRYARSPTASAKSYCLSRAHCSPNRAANRCLFRHFLIALRGTVPAAEKPCASSNGSPLQNSISQAWIPHEQRRQHAPTACSLQDSAAVCASRSEQLPGYSQSHPEIAASQIALPSDHRCPSSATKNRPTELLTASPNAIQYP